MQETTEEVQGLFVFLILINLFWSLCQEDPLEEDTKHKSGAKALIPETT